MSKKEVNISRHFYFFFLTRSFVLGPDQSAVDAVQQRQEAVAYRYRAGQDALRSQPAASQRRQAQGSIII